MSQYLQMYSGDTFFHLTPLGQIGLAIVSTALAMATLWIFFKISSRFGLPVKILVAIILFWLFVWLSPQLYYLYYWLIFDYLPMQIVVGQPPGATNIIGLITFTANANLSDHSKGILFWLLTGSAIWSGYAKRP